MQQYVLPCIVVSPAKKCTKWLSKIIRTIGNFKSILIDRFYSGDKRFCSLTVTVSSLSRTRSFERRTRV